MQEWNITVLPWRGWVPSFAMAQPFRKKESIRSKYSTKECSQHMEIVFLKKKKKAVSISAASMKHPRTGGRYGNQETRSEIIPIPWLKGTPDVTSEERKAKMETLLQRIDYQAKAIGHQVSPLTEAVTSAEDVSPTLVYRPSCPGYFTTESVELTTSVWAAMALGFTCNKTPVGESVGSRSLVFTKSGYTFVLAFFILEMKKKTHSHSCTVA